LDVIAAVAHPLHEEDFLARIQGEGRGTGPDRFALAGGSGVIDIDELRIRGHGGGPHQAGRATIFMLRILLIVTRGVGRWQAPWRRGAGDPGRFRGNGFDWHRAKHGVPPSICLKLLRCRGIVPVLDGLRQQYRFW
jgi:hypothetical protein